MNAITTINKYQILTRGQMITADSENKEPLVIRHKHKRHFLVFRMSKHAYLEIKPEVVESLDALISMLLFLYNLSI